MTSLPTECEALLALERSNFNLTYVFRLSNGFYLVKQPRTAAGTVNGTLKSEVQCVVSLDRAGIPVSPDEILAERGYSKRVSERKKRFEVVHVVLRYVVYELFDKSAMIPTR